MGHYRIHPIVLGDCGRHSSTDRVIGWAIVEALIFERCPAITEGDFSPGGVKMTQEIISSIPGLRDCRQQTLGDPEICIAIIDSRVDLAHRCFAGAQLQEIVPMWLRSVM